MTQKYTTKENGGRNENNRYDDIINLPHHTSSVRPRMSMLERAAQFSPFAALTGHNAAIEETARLTDKYIELDEYEKARLNKELNGIKAHIEEKPEVTVTYFVPDERKDGGAYVTVTGCMKKIEEQERFILMENGTKIAMDMILDLIYRDRRA